MLALYSAQNIDRMVTLFRAAKRTDRSFVMTLYGAAIARATGNPNIPKPGTEWPQVRVYVPGWQRAKVKQAGAFELVDEIKPFRLFEEDLAKTPERWVLSFSWPMAGVLDRAGALGGASAIWSMWPGYLEEPSGSRLQAFLAERSIPMSIHHTSGHASVADLQRLAKALSPARVVPIHSFGAKGSTRCSKKSSSTMTVSGGTSRDIKSEEEEAGDGDPSLDWDRNCRALGGAGR